MNPQPSATRGGGAVLGVGVATLDIVLEVAAFPQEDQEVRALARSRRRGGNAANSLGLLAQLGHAATWMGVIGDDPDAQFVLEAQAAAAGCAGGDGLGLAAVRAGVLGAGVGAGGGSATSGAALMLAFGLGTLPKLLGMGLFARQLQPFMQQLWVRRAAGLTVAGFGVWGLLALARSTFANA